MKETLVTLVISFVLAFVVRAYVIEAFIIPTGSMAPTLMGQHLRFTGADTGYSWPVGPQFLRNGESATPFAIQGTGDNPVIVHDPISGQAIEGRGLRTHSGDRILVFKYLYSIYEPKRFDVVVFKYPGDPDQNFIKRLVGLPGEMVTLIDGDVFARTPRGDDPPVQNGNFWELPGWAIQRKSDNERVQRTVWQMVFDSDYAPRPGTQADAGFRSPWLAGEGWSTAEARRYTYAGVGPTSLTWDDTSRPITDYTPYNDNPHTSAALVAQFPVSDVRSMIVFRPESTGNVAPMACAAILRARGHEFRAEIDGDRAALRMAPLSGDDETVGEWATLAEGVLPRPISPGEAATIDFWHVDQSMELRVNGRAVARGTYEWTPRDRVRYSFDRTLDEIVSEDAGRVSNYFAIPSHYSRPRFQWHLDAGPFTIERAVMWRDLHYQAGGDPNFIPLTTHPLTTLTLSPDHFFVCGDNSPSSADGRVWHPPDSWVASEIDGTRGVVPRDLMIGKAFFVYFPSLIRDEGRRLPMVDFGRMRFIW